MEYGLLERHLDRLLDWYARSVEPALLLHLHASTRLLLRVKRTNGKLKAFSQ